MTRRAPPGVVDADVASGDWRVRAAEAPKIPVADALRALGLDVPATTTLAVFIDDEARAGAAIVMVISPIPHAHVSVAKAVMLGLWGRVAQALPYLTPWLPGGRR